MYETAIGADMGAMTEAEHYVKEVATGEVPFLLTSCCPSWSMLAKKFFPETIDKISNALTPMVATARVIRRNTQTPVWYLSAPVPARSSRQAAGQSAQMWTL